MGKKGKKHTPTSSNSTEFRKRPHNKLVRSNRIQLNTLVDNLLKLASDVPSKLWDQHVEIRELLKKIIELETGLVSESDVDRSNLIASFNEWLSENQASYEGLEIATFPGYGMGLKALKHFKEDSLILTVPRKLMLTDEDAEQSILKCLTEKDPLLKHMSNVRLALYLLSEKVKEESLWRAYIDILPSKYTTVLYFTVEEMEFLKGSPVFERALILYQSIARQYAYFYKLLHTSDSDAAKLLRETFTFDQYRWAVSTVMTRQNTVPSIKNPDSMTLALIPLWDMCNHTEGKITTDFNTDLQRGECFALKDFAEGEQIFIFYGIRTNSNLFLHNGFVYPPNAHDSMTIPLGVSPNDQLKNERLELLEKLRLPTQLQIDYGEEPVGVALLAFTRVFCMTKDELLDWNSNPEFVQLFLPSSSTNDLVSPDLDKRAFAFLHTRFKLILSTYKNVLNTIEEIGDNVKKIDLGNEESKLLQPEDLHRKIVMQLKECEINLLKQAIQYTKEKIDISLIN